MRPHIILTAFYGTSSERLLERLACSGQTLLLLNDKQKSARQLLNALHTAEMPSLIFSFGQRPRMKDKVHIEQCARNGECILETQFDCKALMERFYQNGLAAKLSENAGTSFCNHIYFTGLDSLQRNGLNAEMVFIHIPFEKNISDFDSFADSVLKTIESYEEVS